VSYYARAVYVYEIELERQCGQKWRVTIDAADDERARLQARRAVAAQTGYQFDSVSVTSTKVLNFLKTSGENKTTTSVVNI
jgi:hypothetical protein